MSNIVSITAEEVSLHLNGFFKKLNVGKANVFVVHDEKVDSRDNFQSSIPWKPKKVKSVSEKVPSSIGYAVGDRDGDLEKKIDDLEKSFNVEISSLRIYIEEKVSIL